MGLVTFEGSPQRVTMPTFSMFRYAYEYHVAKEFKYFNLDQGYEFFVQK